MDLNEKKVLCFIKYAPIFVILSIYFLISFFLYMNNYDLFKLYRVEFITYSILFLFISLYVSFVITGFLKKSFIKYTTKLLAQIEENKKKDFMLFQQSKLVAIGELLGNIPHQWRQPLSVITTTASGIKLQKEMGINDEKNEIELLSGIIANANYLSQTIEDFRDFYTPNAPKNNFLISECINDCLKIINPQALNESIKIEKDIEDFQLNGFKNQFLQVLINLFSNSRDKFNENNLNIKIIKIKTYKDKSNYFICFFDNAGGVEEENINKIFEPYFTTKHQYKGTGIGLYMSNQIITKSFNGSLSVSNRKMEYLEKEYLGANFKIRIPLNLDEIKKD